MDKFRSDIEGLRGLAVIAVLGFHLGWALMPGGFVGVDIFLVISGFLMAQIIGHKLNEGSFGIWQFFRGRIFRIWPAMYVLIAVSLVLGVLSLVPADLLKLARSAFASVLLYNNFFLAYEVGYFNGTAVNNVLLHLWSLAVEQQFYLFMPLLMLLVGPQPVRRNWRVMLIPAVLVASLALCVLVTPAKPNSSFYLLPTRLWEFLLGAVVAVWASNLNFCVHIREAIAASGLGLIAISIVAYSGRIEFPGYWAILPAGGSALIIAAGIQEPTLVGRVLSIASIRLVGRLSYSLYLWHWPIIVFSRLRGFAIDALPVQGCILAASLAASYASWRYIEVPFRRPALIGTQRRLMTLAGATVVLVVFSAALVLTDGLPSRLGTEARAYQQYTTYPQRTTLYREGTCFIPKDAPADSYKPAACSEFADGQINLLLWGDSFAAHLVPGLEHDGRRYGVNVTQAAYGGCAPIPAFPENSSTCRAFGQKIWQIAKDKPFTAVLLSADWAGYPEVLPQLERLVSELRSLPRHIVIVGPTMQYPGGLPNLLASRQFGILPASTTTRDWLYKPAFDLDAKMRERFSRIPGVFYFSPLATFCPGGNCPVLLDGNVPLLWDGSHFTKEGSELFAPVLLDKIVPALAAGSKDN
jgi:peptidoglycan/LPS O-acetylase OafA/YrhL